MKTVGIFILLALSGQAEFTAPMAEPDAPTASTGPTRLGGRSTAGILAAVAVAALLAVMIWLGVWPGLATGVIRSAVGSLF